MCAASLEPNIGMVPSGPSTPIPLSTMEAMEEGKLGDDNGCDSVRGESPSTGSGPATPTQPDPMGAGAGDISVENAAPLANNPQSQSEENTAQLTTDRVRVEVEVSLSNNPQRQSEEGATQTTTDTIRVDGEVSAANSPQRRIEEDTTRSITDTIRLQDGTPDVPNLSQRQSEEVGDNGVAHQGADDNRVGTESVGRRSVDTQQSDLHGYSIHRDIDNPRPEQMTVSSVTGYLRTIPTATAIPASICVASMFFRPETVEKQWHAAIVTGSLVSASCCAFGPDPSKQA